MGRSNLIPITRIYDIYPKYTYSDDVKKFMDEIVDIDQVNVYTKDEIITMLTDLELDIEEKESDYKDKFMQRSNIIHETAMNGRMFGCGECKNLIQKKIDALNMENTRK